MLSIGPLLATGLATAGFQTAAPVFQDGMAQVVPAFANQQDWIRERLWVETEFDSDGDGQKDRVHVDVTRQKQTATEALKVAVVYESSPYFAGTASGRSFLWDVNQELGADPPPRQMSSDIPFDPNRTRVSNSLTNVWVPRGFAVVHSEAPGTGLSTGSPTVGGMAERYAPKAVIDWLNGRAKGYTAMKGGEETKATWSTGKVGMVGTSYNGTIPVAAATTGVDGLAAIIPVAPNTSYYHYYRSNGLVRHPGGWLGEDIDSLYEFINSGDPARREASNRLYRDKFLVQRDRQHGDYNEFWAERDLLNHVQNIKCAVLMSHAFNDWNVVPEHSVSVSLAIKGKVPLVQYFHQGGHGGDPPLPLINKWFSRFLYGVQNGVETGPKAYIVRESDPAGASRQRGEPVAYEDYPNPAAKMVTFGLSPGGTAIGGLHAGRVPQIAGQESLTDDVGLSPADLAKAESSPARLMYATPVLREPVHISGTARLTIRMAASTPAVNLSAYLVQLPWINGQVSTANIVTRGWADPQNWRALGQGGRFVSKTPGTPLTPGGFVTFKFDLQPDDQVIPAGRRLALMVFSSDKDFTLWPKPGSKITLSLEDTRLDLPIVGGQAQFDKATAGD